MSEFLRSACPHDCPSACALEVERLSDTRIGRVRGSRHYSYTDGAVCAKVARYAERIHHPDRLSQPLRRSGPKGGGPKGSGQFMPVTWDQALDEIAEAFTRSTQRFGAESVWPYHSGGTMGVVLVVIGVLASAVTAYVYFRIIVLMYFTQAPEDDVVALTPSVATTIVVTVGVLATLLLGIVPGLLLQLAQDASTFLL